MLFVERSQLICSANVFSEFFKVFGGYSWEGDISKVSGDSDTYLFSSFLHITYKHSSWIICQEKKIHIKICCDVFLVQNQDLSMYRYSQRIYRNGQYCYDVLNYSFMYLYTVTHNKI